MGLTTAFYLAKGGARVTILEKEKQIGGLSRSVQILHGIRWDRFYHVILSTDKDLLDYIDDIGLSLDVKFKETKTGFYTDGQLLSISNTIEFLRFKPLSLWNKIRLGLGIIYISKIRITTLKGCSIIQDKTFTKCRIFNRTARRTIKLTLEYCLSLWVRAPTATT